jgi:hypothetical protein
MRFQDALKYSMATYPTLYPDRAAVLNQFFVVNGNGMDFSGETGELEDRHGNSPNDLVAIERYVASGKHKEPMECVEYVPAEFAEHLFVGHRVTPDIEERLAKAEFNHWYPMSKGYNGLEKLPDNIPADWLNAAYECATLVVNTPQDLNLEETAKRNAYQWLDETIFDKQGYKVIGKKKNTREEAEAKSLKSLKAERKRIHDIAAKALVDMKAQFPNHKFEFNPPPTWDAERPFDKNGTTPWPMEGEGESWRGVGDFETLVEPFIKATKFAYKMSRKNRGKDIPYHGYTTTDGRSLSPQERFTAESLEYDETDQGRDALTVILGSLASVAIEYGKRLALKEVREHANNYFRHKKFEEEHAAHVAKQRELAKSDPMVAARVRIQDRMEAGKKGLDRLESSNFGTIAYNPSDLLEVAAAREMYISRRKTAKMLSSILDKAEDGESTEAVDRDPELSADEIAEIHAAIKYIPPVAVVEAPVEAAASVPAPKAEETPDWKITTTHIPSGGGCSGGAKRFVCTCGWYGIASHYDDAERLAEAKQDMKAHEREHKRQAKKAK